MPMWMCGDRPTLLKQLNGKKKTELKQVNGIKKTDANQTDGKQPGESLIASNKKSIRKFNTLPKVNTSASAPIQASY